MSQNCCTAPTHKWMNEDLCEQASQFRVFKHNTFYIAWQRSVIDTQLRWIWILCNRNKIEELWITPMPLSPDQRLTESMPECRCRPLAALRQGRSSGQFCGGRHIPLLAAHRENLWSWSLHRHQIHWRLHSGKTCGHGLRPDTRYNMKVSKGKMKTFDYLFNFQHPVSRTCTCMSCICCALHRQGVEVQFSKQ